MGRNYCGNELSDGLEKDHRFNVPIVTPTTKGETDELITPCEIIERGILTQDQWKFIKSRALDLFSLGEEIASLRNLILVDTKYEFGFCVETGKILLIDEIHTGDSSRYWSQNDFHMKS